MLGAGAGVEPAGAAEPPVAASAVAALVAQAMLASSTSTSVYVLGANRILIDAYGVS
jgi:hypothetical protein